MARLPTPGGDDGTWGGILNDFLDVEHNPDGSQKTLPLTKGGTGAIDASTARTNLGAITRIQDASDVAISSSANGDLITYDSSTSKWKNGSGGSLSSAAYRLVSDGTTVTAYDKKGTVVASGTDGGAVLTACLPADSSAGTTIEFRNDGNVFPWATVPALPKGITNKLYIDGNGATVQLSAAGPRFLDFNRTADYQTFQHIEVVNFIVDANHVDGAMHTIIGTRAGPSVAPDQRINLIDIVIRRIRAINIPETVTNRSGISFGTRQQAGGEATQTVIKDILFEDVWVDGAISGFGVTGGNAGALTNLNIFYDNIRMIRCKHTSPAQAVKPLNSDSFGVGQNMPGGYVLLEECYGEYQADVGMEIDNATHADVIGCVMANCKTGYLTTNFAPPQYANAQVVTYARCQARVTDATVTTACVGWNVNISNALPIGNIVYDDCVYEQTNNVQTNATAGHMFQFNTGANVRRATIRDCKMDVSGINYNNAANTDPFRALMLSGSTIGLLEVDGLDVHGAGTTAGGGGVLFRCFDHSATGSVYLRVDNVTIDWLITGQPAIGASYAFYFVPTGATSIGGSVLHLRIVNLGNDTGAHVFRFASTTNLTITSPPFSIEECDFAGLTTAGNEMLVDATQTALGAVATRRNRWKTKPAPVALTGLATGTGKVLGAQATTVFWSAIVQFVQGSGASITAIDYSTNDGTNYTNFLTQASSALPIGFDQSIGPLTSDALIKVTFTGTQPTINLVPVDP